MAERSIEQEQITHGLATAIGGLLRDQLRSVEDRHRAYRRQAEGLIADLRARVSHVEALAERAAQKGYDLDPHEVLIVTTPPDSRTPEEQP